MSKLRNSLLSLGLEEHDNTPPAGETVLVDSVAEDIVEINEAADVVDEHEEVTEELTETAEGLEAIALSIESTLKSGGMGADAAMFATHAINAHLQPLGIKNTLPSVESFGASATKLGQTQVGLENLKEKIKEIWEYIKNLITRMRKAVMDYYNRVWAAAPRLRKRAEAIRAKADGITTAAKKDEVEVSAGLAAKLAIGDKVPTDFAAQLGVVEKVAETLFSKYVTDAIAWAKRVEDAVGQVKFESDEAFQSSAAALGNIEPLVVAGLADQAVASGDKRFEKLGEGVTVKRSADMMGNMAVFHHSMTGSKGDLRSELAALQKAHYYLAASTDAKLEVKADKLATMKKAEIVAAADKVAEIAVLIEKFKRNVDESDKAKEGALRAGDKVSSAAAKASDKLNAANQSTAGSVVRLLQHVPSVIDQPNQKFSQHILAVCGSVLSLCEKSLAQY